MDRRAFTASSLFALPALADFAQNQSPAAVQASHEAWVLSAINQMNTITVGMTRSDLLKVFQRQGGYSSLGAQTFLSRACRYFKVDVEFARIGQDEQGRPRFGDDIVRISRPYLDKQIIDG